MDEPFARELRHGLAELLEPARGEHPLWASSPAAARVASAGAGQAARRRHWLLVAAATIAALTVGAATLLAGGIRLPDPLRLPWLEPDRSSDQTEPRQPPELTVIELDGVGPEHSVILDLAPDPDGRHVWALAAWGTNHEPDDRVLIRSDAETGTATAWELDPTHAEDAAPLVPAREGGVWLIGPDGATLHRFDATGRVASVVLPRIRTRFDDPKMPAPFLGALDVAEAPDGRLWVATARGLYRQDDGTWSKVATPGLADPQARESVGATRLAIGDDGSVWAALIATSESCVIGSSSLDCGWTTPLGVGRYDGAAWVYYDGDDAAPLAQPIHALEVGPDGSVWVGNGVTYVVENEFSVLSVREVGAVARFDGRTWQAWDQADLGLAAPFDVSIAPDGTVLVLGSAPPHGADTASDAAWVSRLDGSGWKPLTEGLPDEPLGATAPPVAALVALDRDRAYAGTARGLYRLADGLWEPDESSVGPPGATLIEETPPGEHWVIGRDGIWVLRAGGWSRPVDEASVGGTVRAAAVGPDGAIWTVGSGGVARHDEGGTAFLDERRASGVALASDGRVWVYGGEVHGIDVYGPTLDGDGWSRVDHLATPFRVVADLAFTSDGAAWIAGDGTTEAASGCVARRRDGSWSVQDPTPSAMPCRGLSLAVGPDGSVWLTFTARDIFLATGTPTLALFANEAWQLYGLEDGLPGDFVAVGGDGTVWVAGSEGLFRLVGDRWAMVAGGTFADVRVDADGAVWVHSFGSMWRVDS